LPAENTCFQLVSATYNNNKVKISLSSCLAMGREGLRGQVIYLEF
jgi:hypothetical protein